MWWSVRCGYKGRHRRGSEKQSLLSAQVLETRGAHATQGHKGSTRVGQEAEGAGYRGWGGGLTCARAFIGVLWKVRQGRRNRSGLAG